MPIESPNITSYLMTRVMFDLFLAIYEIFQHQIKCPKFDLENEWSRSMKRKNGTFVIQPELFDSIFMFFLLF